LTVKPPSIEETILILNGLKDKYERHHKVRYSTEALHAAAALSERYIHSRFLPDKAIDLIDEAGARQRMISLRQPSSLKDLDESIIKAKKDKEIAIAQQDYEKAARLRDNEKNLIDDQKRVLHDWQKMKDEARIDIREEHILEVLATTTGIPLKKLSESEHERMILMENTLKKWVIGQSKAIERCCKALIRSKADIKDIHRPIGSYLFLGPTGVGKTHLAKSIANYMFGSSDALIHVDMSEYMEKHTVARMIGSPPGYVGHEEGGQLTERVRQRPHCVVLFDEIEKAHHDVANILLQILEDGQLTDSLGRKVDFRNTIIILTSNLGSEQFANRSNLGFGAGSHEVPEEAIRDGILKAASKFFRPELINRLDDQIIFLPFKKEDLHKIALLELEKLHQRCIKKFVYLEFTEQVLDFIIEKGYSPDQGARPLRRAVERHIEEPLAEMILKKHPESMTRFKATLEEGIIQFTTEIMPEEENIGPPATLLAKK
jgi:ATP-dependent Clp protease ATP-binding subunit ClpC